jgi:hypothetical protein
MNKNILIGLVAIFVISIASLGLGLAFRGNPEVKGPNYDLEVHEQLEQAMQKGDYDAWMQIREDNNLPTKGRMFQVINAENFDLYVEMHNAMLSGDTAKADEIRQELGLGQGMRNGSPGTCKMSENTQSGCQQNSGSCPMTKTGTCPMRS